MDLFQPCSTDLFFRSTKTGDPRLGELVNSTTSAETTYVIAGYGDDEGIGLNGGRMGAAQAPDVIRKYFYRMSASPWKSPSVAIKDVGNLGCDRPLAERHDQLKATIAETLQQEDKRWIGLGGGHDYGYPDGAGFLKNLGAAKYKPLVINFDAHLDVRPTDQGLSSGTPFYRLLTDDSLPAFDFVEVGLQSQCNSRTHLQWLEEKGATVLPLDSLLEEPGVVENTLAKLSNLLLQPRPTFLSIDIDAFSSAYAPGCSQSWATGLVPNDFLMLLRVLKKRLDVRMLSIYEVSPPLDVDDRTSKLAAQIIHHFIYG